MSTTLFISDLHLDEQRPAISRAFFQFLENNAKNAETLYILGDFFESWIGDDDQSELIEQTRQALRALVDSGTKVAIMHGNRDFLLGEGFCRSIGATLLSDPSIIDLNGKKTLLMHGDSLCTTDSEYIQFRAMARSTAWQKEVLAKPLEERRALAQQLRMASKEANSNKAEDIMDVTTSEVIRVMQEHDCMRLIHGHTHRPARHPLTIGGKTAERIVLGDWDTFGWALESSQGELKLEKFPI